MPQSPSTIRNNLLKEPILNLTVQDSQKKRKLEIDMHNTSGSDNGKEKNIIEALQQQLDDEKENNRYLKNQMSKMHDQISKLTDTIEKLNEAITKLQSNKNGNEKLNRSRTKKTKTNNENNNSVTNTKQKPNATQTNNANATPAHSPNGNINKNITSNNSSNGNEMDITPPTAEERDEPNTTNTNEFSGESQKEKNTSLNDESDEEEETDTNTYAQNEKITRTSKIPPIDIWTENHQATQQIIRHNMPDFSCVFTRLNKSKIRVFPKSIQVRNKLIELLRQRNINYNTYTPSDERMQSVLLKGTEIDNSSTIINTLSEHGIVPHNVQLYETGYMRKNNVKSNIWQVTLQPKTDTNTLTNIRYIAEWSVKWELQRKRAITQCRRCQRFNHSASNCTLPYRCVKCINTHAPGECPIDSSDNKTKPCCVNCKGEHTANNARLCPYFKRQLEIKTTKSKQTQSKKNHASSNQPIQPPQKNTQTYASAVSSNHQQRKPSTNKTSSHQQYTHYDIKLILEENQKSMRDLMQSVFESQNKFMNALINCNVSNNQ